MSLRIRPWRALGLFALLCLALGAALYFYRDLREQSVANLVRRLPEGSLQAGIDAEALRRAGVLQMLSGSPSVQEQDYKDFVEGTGFDYTRDLDYVLAAFRDDDIFFLLKGRFDWERLQQWARNSRGTCLNTFCEAPASRPERKISFYPVSRGVLALAVSSKPQAAWALAEAKAPAPASLPADPVWLRVPGPMLQSARTLPDGTRAFVSALRPAHTVTLALNGAGQELRLRLDAACGSPSEATGAKERLEELTRLLRSLIERSGHQPNPKDLSGVLTSGSFSVDQTSVRGEWKVSQAFLQSLVSGN